jgi:hypothetical protein
MTVSTHRLLFTIAALFNWSVGVLIVFGNATTWKLFGLPPPHETLFVHLFAVLVVAFGAAYFWIGMDPAGKRPLILFSAAGKLTVFATVVVEYFAGNAPLLLVGPGAGDLVFAILFLRAAARLP